MLQEQKENQKRPVLQFPGNSNTEKENEKEQPDIGQVFFLLLRRNGVLSVINEGINIFKDTARKINIVELFIASEYSLTNYSALQAVINFMEDNYKPTKEKLNRLPTPNDLHDVIIKAVSLYYMICKKSGFYKIAVEENIESSESEIRTKIMTPMAAFLSDALTQAMQSTKAIGSALASYDAVSQSILYEAGIHRLEDEESKKLVTYSEAVANEILTPTMRDVLNDDSWMEKIDQNTISKLIYKTCLYSYISVSINDMLKDIVNKHLPMGVFLNALMMSSHAISTLAIEERTVDQDSSFNEAIVSITEAASFAICSIFESKEDRENHPALKFIPQALANILDTYNILVTQVNAGVEENAKKLELEVPVEKLVMLNKEEIEECQKLLDKIIREDISTALASN